LVVGCWREPTDRLFPLFDLPGFGLFLLLRPLPSLRDDHAAERSTEQPRGVVFADAPWKTADETPALPISFIALAGRFSGFTRGVLWLIFVNNR